MKTNNGNRYEVTFGQQQVPFTLVYRDKVRLAISVHPDRSVSVVAPRGRTVEDVVERVQRRAEWIVKQRAYFEQFQPLTPPRQYCAGETHFYLGRQYRLKVAKKQTENR